MTAKAYQSDSLPPERRAHGSPTSSRNQRRKRASWVNSFGGGQRSIRKLTFSRSSGATCICRNSFMTPSKVDWKPQARGHKRVGGARRIRTDASRSRSAVEGADEACAGSEEERDVTAGEECPRAWWCRIAVRLTLYVRLKSALRSLMYLGMDWM